MWLEFTWEAASVTLLDSSVFSKTSPTNFPGSLWELESRLLDSESCRILCATFSTLSTPKKLSGEPLNKSSSNANFVDCFIGMMFVLLSSMEWLTITCSLCCWTSLVWLKICSNRLLSFLPESPEEELRPVTESLSVPACCVIPLFLVGSGLDWNDVLYFCGPPRFGGIETWWPDSSEFVLWLKENDVNFRLFHNTWMYFTSFNFRLKSKKYRYVYMLVNVII